MANEKRLIDASAVYALFDQNGTARLHVADIDLIPRVDAVEVVHGRWERAEYHGFLHCSECKRPYIDDTWVADEKWNYCPNCGAKMDMGVYK